MKQKIYPLKIDAISLTKMVTIISLLSMTILHHYHRYILILYRYHQPAFITRSILSILAKLCDSLYPTVNMNTFSGPINFPVHLPRTHTHTHAHTHTCTRLNTHVISFGVKIKLLVYFPFILVLKFV